jgi:hypothetical protein
MPAYTFDTHKAVTDLKSAGFTDQQAEAVAAIVRDAEILDLSNLATRGDLALVRSDIEGLRIASRTELAVATAGLERTIAETRSALGKTVVETRADLEKTIAETKAEILKWMVSVIGIQTVVIIGAVVALVRR